MDIRVESAVVNSRGGGRLLGPVSCAFRKRRVTLLVGQVGSGKSTLLDAASGLIRTDEGTVAYGGEPLWTGRRRGRPSSRLLRATGIVFQQAENMLFARTVRDEFAYSLKPLRLPEREAQARTERAMRAMALPESMLARNPLTLSGGQQRRVALACVLAAQPAWLLLDEPTAGLDGEGAELLIDTLKMWMRGEPAGGIVIATHDLELLLPIADDIVILRRGADAVGVTRDELLDRPQPLIDAGLPLPDSIRFGARLRARGIRVPTADALAPARLADELAARMRPSTIGGAAGGVVTAHAAVDEIAACSCEKAGGSAERQPSAIATAASAPAAVEPPAQAAPLFAGFDPRALWLFLLCVSAGMFVQRTWTGIALSAGIAAAIVAVSRVPLAGMWRALRALGLFTAVAVLLAGLQLEPAPAPRFIGGVDFSAAAALVTLRRLAPIVIVLPVGLLLTLSMSHLQLKRGIEQGLAPLKRIGLPVEAFALAVSLLFRFMPLIAAEWERFSRIARARAKTVNKPGTIPVGQLRAVILPLLLSLLQTAERAAFALEMRGYKRIGQPRTSAVTLRLKSRDYGLMAAGVCLLGFLLWTAYR